MAKRTLKCLLNVGFDDQKKYAIPEGSVEGMPPVEGDVITVDEGLAKVLVNVLQVAEDYDVRADKAHAEEVRDADIEAVRPDVEARLAREAAEKAAENGAKKK